VSDELIEALNRIAKAIDSNTAALRSLGTGDAGTTMGAIEYLAVTIKESGAAIVAELAQDTGIMERVWDENIYGCLDDIRDALKGDS
jgi:hypothetical protein